MCLSVQWICTSWPRVGAPQDPWTGLADHCKHLQPIPESEIVARQHALAQALHRLHASAYVAEPGGSALFFGNISSEAWPLSERPLLLVVSPVERGDDVVPKVIVLTPYFEESRARSLSFPGVDVVYVPWREDEDPYAVGVGALPVSGRGPIYVDGMTRHFIVDGLQKAAPGARVALAPVEITSLRERKSTEELALLSCVNEVGISVALIYRLYSCDSGHTPCYPGCPETDVYWYSGITNKKAYR